jgi:hypothetical protein
MCITETTVHVTVKVNQFLYRAGQVLKVQEVDAPCFKKIGTRMWEGCHPYATAAFIPREIFLISFGS